MSSKSINDYGLKINSIRDSIIFILTGSNLQFTIKDFVSYFRATQGYERKDTIRALFYLQEAGKIKLTDNGFVLRSF